MGNIALQIGRSLTGTVGAGENVIFDAAVYSTGNISYNNSTGVITLNESGRYVIHWWVATQSSTFAGGAIFALVSSQGDLLTGNSPLKAGEITGVGIISVAIAPITVSLVNGSAGNYGYAAQMPLKATLVVIRDDVAAQETMSCFAVAQLANILSQMITTYSATTWSVFSQSLASYSGMPLDLYTSPNATGPGILRLIDVNSDYEALPIANITAVYPGGGTVYDPSFTYLSPPDPLPPGCDTDMVAAVQSYLPIGTAVEIRLGPAIVASGAVYRNEYGVLVLSDGAGNTPVFIATPHILRIFTSEDPATSLALRNGSIRPRITLLKE